MKEGKVSRIALGERGPYSAEEVVKAFTDAARTCGWIVDKPTRVADEPSYNVDTFYFKDGMFAQDCRCRQASLCEAHIVDEAQNLRILLGPIVEGDEYCLVEVSLERMGEPVAFDASEDFKVFWDAFLCRLPPF
ncbi:MAG: hypothetical protein HGB37_00120 [Candidatus Moranbacteria bacterium]|nr:hypothetical protein [Candidatus Moranbacteria bacterium]NTW89311.1 hypothetical protein [Candidatus Moranbacteria bacterium]